MARVQSLPKHLLTELRESPRCGEQLNTVLQDFAKQAATPALRMAFAQHLEENQGQIRRLQQRSTPCSEAAANRSAWRECTA